MQSAEWGARLHLVDLRLKKVEANLSSQSTQRPFDLLASVAVEPHPTRSEFIEYDVKYTLTVKDRDNLDVMDAEITLNSLYRIRDRSRPTEADIRAFGLIGAVDVVHPHMREIVQTLTGRMGLPPLVLDFHAPEPVDPD
ncbi:hypothetical protein ACWDUH_02800 [Micromonospora wenchangensis]